MSGESPAMSARLATFAYRACLSLYPPALRERHGEEMVHAFSKRLERGGRAGSGGRRGLVASLIRDLSLSLPAAWRAERARVRRERARAGRGGGGSPGGGFVGDVRLALRWFRRSPAVAALAVATLALGIGANTAMFSVLDGVLLEPLPYPQASRVVRVMSANALSLAQVDAIAEQSRSYASLAAVAPTSLTLVGDGEPIEVGATLAGAQVLDVLGVVPAHGRGLRAEDVEPGAEPVALLSWELFQQRFGGDPSVVGRTIDLGGRGHARRTIVGVVPRGFDLAPWMTEAVIPVTIERDGHDYRDMIMYWGIGRLDDGVTLAEADAELRTVAARLASADDPLFTETTAAKAGVVTYHEARVGNVRGPLWLLLGAVVVVLLIACTNVANLLLARSGERARELAMRSALGASRARLVRQLLTESTVLAMLGGVLGVAFAALALTILRGVLADELPRAEQISIDLRVLAFTVVLSVAAGLVFGLVPALRSSFSTRAALGEGGRASTHGRRRLLLNRALVSVEVGLCVVLVVAAGLLSKSLMHLASVDPGFEPAGAVTVRVVPPEGAYPDEESRRRLYDRLEEAVAAAPGVEAAGAVNLLPLSRGNMGVGISPDGEPVLDSEDPLTVGYRLVTPGYFAAVGVPLIEGRLFEPSDREDAVPRGLVNATLARRLFGDESAVGETVSWDNGEPWFTVIGVIGDMRQSSLGREVRPEAYVPYGQEPWITAMSLVARGSTGAALLETARQAIAEVDPRLPVTRATTLDQVVRRSMQSSRLYARLFLGFGGVALLLAVIGVYGVLAYVVSQRRHEIGVRLAVGASGSEVVRSVLGGGLAPVAVGLAVGGVVALSTSRLLADLLFEVRPGDPSVLVGALVCLGLVALVASLVPALRAARVDPMRTLTVD